VGGKRQQRQQGKRIARANQKLTKEQIEIALNSFYSIKNPKELCELLYPPHQVHISRIRN
jgi:hypothetical protein